MNTIKQVEIKYIRPSRTIEKIEISNDISKSLCFVYNYNGYHFRLFESEMALNSFLKIGSEPKFTFSSEEELDDFLLHHFENI